MKRERTYYVYLMTNKRHTVLYVGVTNNLFRRVLEHKNKVYPQSFTSKYNVEKLVFYCFCSDIADSISFEKKLKGGSRKKKIGMVDEFNPNWNDLSEEIGIE